MTSMKKAFQLLGIYDELLRVMTPEEIDALAELPLAQAEETLKQKLAEAEIAMTPAVIDKVLREQGLRV